MKKPSIKMTWRGVKGNKFRSWTVNVDGKAYQHTNKTKAHNQYKSAMRLYKKVKARK